MQGCTEEVTEKRGTHCFYGILFTVDGFIFVQFNNKNLVNLYLAKRRNANLKNSLFSINFKIGWPVTISGGELFTCRFSA